MAFPEMDSVDALLNANLEREREERERKRVSELDKERVHYCTT